MASAQGCTTAPGSYSAVNCIEVQGSGQYVENTTSRYQYLNPAASGVAPAVCNRKHQWIYKDILNQGAVRNVNPAGCVSSTAAFLTGAYAKLSANLWVGKGQFCARTNNTATNGAWTAYACINIG